MHIPQWPEIGKPYNPFGLFIGAWIPEWLLRRKEISSQAKLCFARLCQHAGRDGRVYPRIITISTEIGEAKRTVERALKELRDHKLVQSHRRGIGRSNSYTFLMHEWINEASRDGLIRQIGVPDPPPLAQHRRDSKQEKQKNEGSRRPEGPRHSAGEGCGVIRLPSEFTANKEITDLWSEHVPNVLFHFESRNPAEAPRYFKRQIGLLLKWYCESGESRVIESLEGAVRTGSARLVDPHTLSYL